MLVGMASTLEQYAASGAHVWCIFDNTALGYATSDALSVKALIESEVPVDSTAP
jgi:uncharacterized protein YecE (DUF72 family)